MIVKLNTDNKLFRLCLSGTTRLPGTGLGLPLHLPWQVFVEEIFLVLVQTFLVGIFYFLVLFKPLLSPSGDLGIELV